MKRKREIERADSEIRCAIGELSLAILKAKPPSGDDDDDHHHHHLNINNGNNKEASHIPTKPFLHLCGLLIQVLDKIGPSMAVLRQDLTQNIQRLEMVYEGEPSKYGNVGEILKKEVGEGCARKGNSCSRSFVWLTRSMDFSVALLEKLAKDPGKNMEQAVEESYSATLKQWHGWISSAAYKVALKLVPDNKTFINLLMGQEEDDLDTLQQEIQTLITLLVPLLEDIHSILRSYGLDRLKSI